MSPQPVFPENGLTCRAKSLRVLHDAIGAGELVCLGYVWFCALARRRDVWLRASIAVLTGEGIGLVVAKGCPLGGFQRRAGDDVPMFELWFGPRLAPLAVPAFTAIAFTGAGLLGLRPAQPPAPGSTSRGACRSANKRRQGRAPGWLRPPPGRWGHAGRYGLGAFPGEPTG